MFKIEEREYQKKIIDDLIDSLNSKQKILVQLSTGGGKTIIFSSAINSIIKDNKSKVIILCHRDELVQQTIDSLNSFGVMCCPITAKTKIVSNEFKVYVSMVETLHNRFKKDKNFITEISHVFIDECHIGSFDKIIDIFYDKKIIGFTATPIRNKRFTIYQCNYCDKQYATREKCCYNENVEKWSIPFVLSTIYEKIIIGPLIQTLIKEEHLVDEVVFSYDYYKDLETKGDDDYDENEIAEESAKHDLDVLAEYEEKSKGKKTMIFTASTKQNVSLVSVFNDAGYDAKSYDTRNNQSSERSEVLEWYKDNQSAILVSTGTFTTGFDDKEVETIIVNRPTKSLSLWHQMIGRGGRTSKKIYKPYFTVIDLGGNVQRLGKWSDELDWEAIFYNGLIPAKKKKEILIQCEKCAYNWIGQNSDECPDCGHKNKPPTREPTAALADGVDEPERATIKTTAVSVVPIPSGRKIAEFVKRTTNSKNDYYRIIIEKYVDLWRLNRVDLSVYLARCESGKLEERIKQYLRTNYRYVNSLDEGVPRTYEYLENKIKEKLKACYIVKP